MLFTEKRSTVLKMKHIVDKYIKKQTMGQGTCGQPAGLAVQGFRTWASGIALSFDQLLCVDEKKARKHNLQDTIKDDIYLLRVCGLEPNGSGENIAGLMIICVHRFIVHIWRRNKHILKTDPRYSVF